MSCCYFVFFGSSAFILLLLLALVGSYEDIIDVVAARVGLEFKELIRLYCENSCIDMYLNALRQCLDLWKCDT